jgi:hypothetical protein
VEASGMPENDIRKFRDFPGTEIVGTVRDFIVPIVEFLGILVPGVVFIFAFIPALVVPLAKLITVIDRPFADNTHLLTSGLIAHIVAPSFGTLFLLSILSYVVGHVFFRQDPKLPDERSFLRVKRTIGESGPVRLGENEKKYNADNNRPDEYNLEFPYRYLKEYLQERGMEHLARMVPWSGNDPTTYPLRTKHFINILKVRLEFLFPYQYLRIQRNEAHVRLMSSMWYAAKALFVVSLIGTCIGIVSSGISMAVSDSFVWPVPHFTGIVLPLLILILAATLKRQIEDFLHYQRIREVVFLLEAAYFANRLYPDIQFVEQHTAAESLQEKQTIFQTL